MCTISTIRQLILNRSLFKWMIHTQKHKPILHQDALSLHPLPLPLRVPRHLYKLVTRVTGWKSWPLWEVAIKETLAILVRLIRVPQQWVSVCAGVVARKETYLPYIKKALSSEAVAKYFAHFLEENSQVKRYNTTLTCCLVMHVMHTQVWTPRNSSSELCPHTIPWRRGGVLTEDWPTGT